VWEPTLIGRPIGPVGKTIFASIARDIERHFGEW
jgi:hypothetical protein